MIEPAQQGRPGDNGAGERITDSSRAGGTQAAATVDVANVLRRTFQATIDETVPDEMLDLLSKLS